MTLSGLCSPCSIPVDQFERLEPQDAYHARRKADHDIGRMKCRETKQAAQGWNGKDHSEKNQRPSRHPPERPVRCFESFQNGPRPGAVREDKSEVRDDER